MRKSKSPYSVHPSMMYMEHGTNAKAQAAADEYLAEAPRSVESQYAGKKSALRPIFEKILSIGLSLGDDVKACPCQTMVPLYRKHVFAQIKPTTQTRIDLGLCIRGMKTPKRLIDTGGAQKGDRITHRIEIASVNEVDDFVVKWMTTAYELDGHS